MKRGLKTLQEHCEFNNPYDCYVLLAVSRKKDVPHITNSQEIIFREVIKGDEDIKKKYLKIKAMCESYRDEEGRSYPFYLYVSLNARDSLKATFALQGKINLWVEETMRGVDRSQFFKKVYGHFYSTLMHKESKSKYTKYFMFDIDTKDEADIDHIEYIFDGVVDVRMKIETKNGWHYKVKPFNAMNIQELLEDKEYKDLIELKRDANLYIEYIDNGKSKIEIWLPINDIIGYEISNYGRVRSINRSIYTMSRWGKRMQKNLSGKIMSNKTDGNGYKFISLSNNGNKSIFRINRLVLCTFDNKPYKYKLWVNHIDGIITNNHISNLEWVTASENQIHAFKIGLKKPTDNSKLTEQQVIKIRNEYIGKRGQQIALAEKYGVTQSNISAIVLNKSWRTT